MNYTETFTIAGKDAHRVDGIEKVTGKAVYTGDIQLSGDGLRQDTSQPGGPCSLAQGGCV